VDEPGSLTRPWGLGDALAGILVGLVGSSIVVSAAHVDADSSIGLQFLAYIPLWLGLGLAPVVATRRRGRGPVADLRLAVRPIDLLALPLGGLVQVVVGAVYTLFVDRHDVEAPSRQLADAAHGAGGKVLLVAMTIVIAPALEELFYRGLVLRSLTRAMSPVAAAVVCGLLFGAMHFQPLQLIGLAVFGTLAAGLALRTGRLGSAVLAHVGFNAVALWSLHIF
jgi:membrane protease YdiL (CAAX protease family)